MVDTIYLDTENEAPAERIWVFLSRDADGREGIVSATIGDQNFPLVTATPRLVEKMEGLARKAAEHAEGKKIVLVEYTTRRDVKEIKR